MCKPTKTKRYILDSYAVHYGLVGSDIRVQCLTNSDGNNAKVNVFKWDYTKVKTSKITGKLVTFKNLLSVEQNS